MSLYDEFLAYRDQYGLNGLNTENGVGLTTQNGALFTFEYLICLLEDPNTPDRIKDQEVARLFSVYKSLESPPGYSRRTPVSLEGDSMDNNDAMLAFSAYGAGRGFARRMIEAGEYVECKGPANDPDSQKYFLLARLVTATQMIWRPWTWKSWFKSGFKPKFFWTNSDPQSFTSGGWFGRSPGFLGNMDLAATGWTTPFRWLGVLVGQFLGCFADKGNTDARKLPYVMWWMLTKCTRWEHRWFWCLMYKLWVFILLRQYPNGMRDVYALYYQDPNHPIRKYSKRYFGEKT